MRSEIHVIDRNGTREQGPVSITGQKFTNWHRNAGGGGAIDLVMHLADLDVSAAVVWLEQHALPAMPPQASSAHHASSNQQAARAASPLNPTGQLRLPIRDPSKLPSSAELSHTSPPPLLVGA